MADNIDDRIQFTDEDRANGGYIPTRDQNGTLRVRQLGRLAGGVKDKMTMAMQKADIAALWRDGETYDTIAESVSDKYGLEGDQRFKGNSIHYHIKKMLDYWRDKGLARIDERRAMILARLDQIEALCVEAYFASMEGKRTTQYNKQIERAMSKDRKDQLLGVEKKKRDGIQESDKRKKPDPSLFQTEGDIGTEDLLLVTAEKINRNVRNEENQAGDPKFLNLMFGINKERAKILGLHNRTEELNPDQESAKLTDEARQQRLQTLLSSAKERRQATANMLADPAPLGGFLEGEEPPLEVTQPEVDEDDWGFGPEEDEVEWD